MVCFRKWEGACAKKLLLERYSYMHSEKSSLVLIVRCHVIFSIYVPKWLLKRVSLGRSIEGCCASPFGKVKRLYPYLQIQKLFVESTDGCSRALTLTNQIQAFYDSTL